jgi:hypothetical protein
LVVEADPLSAPGLYRGSLRVVPEAPGMPRQDEYVIDYEWEVVELLAVQVQTDVMEFGNAGPGITECRYPAVFWVHSNHWEAEIVVSMEPLTGVNNSVTLPNTATCIGWGLDAGSARQSALSAPFGQNELRFVLGPGAHKIAIHSRVQLSVAEPAGTYTGRIVITSRVIR